MGSRAGRAVAAVWLALGVLVLCAAPAFAQVRDPAVAELGLAVEAGFDGRVVSSRWLPVSVRVDPARAVRGVLVVESRSASGIVREQQAVEVAARTPSVFRFVVPAGRVTVSVQEPDRDAVTVSSAAQPEERTYLAGVLGRVPDGAPSLRHDPTGLSGAWVGVDPEWLDRSGQALDPLDALVAGSADLEALPPEARHALVTAVAAGMDLVVVLPAQGTGVDLEPLRLPARLAGARGAVVPGAGTWVIDGPDGEAAAAALGFGRGRVVAAGAAPGPASGALWNHIVEPAGRTALGSEWSVDRHPRMFAALFGDEDAAPPALPWLAGFAVAYVLVVGPVNGVLLARLGRRELAWLTVPVITVVFTLAALLGVAGGHPPVGDAARLVVSIDGASTEVVAATVRAPTEGARTMEVNGPGWTVRALVDGGGRATVRHGAGGASAAFDLRALQPGGLLASRPLATVSPLGVSAVQQADGSITAEVSNGGSQTIEAVVVRAATARAHVGTLEPGTSTVVEVGGASLPLAPVWGNPFGDVPSRLPGSLLALLRDDLLDGNPGLVWAAGTLPAGWQDHEVVIEGQPARDRGWLMATAVTPSLAGPAGPFAVERAAVVRGEGHHPSPLAVEGAREAYLRLRLPAGADVPVLVADLDRGEGRPAMEVWMPAEREWRPAADVFEGERASPDAVLGPLGSVWVRATGDLHPFDFSGRTVHALDDRTGRD